MVQKTGIFKGNKPGKVPHILLRKSVISVLLTLMFFLDAHSQFANVNGKHFQENDIFVNYSNDNSYRSFHPNIKKTPGHYSAYDWARVIDSVWGPGISNYTKAIIFKNFWNIIDSNYACFHNLNNINWSNIRLVYYPMVVQGVSRGRFSGIMSYLSLMLRDVHTLAFDTLVFRTALDPGVPLFYTGGWNDNSHFGAGLTPMPDSSLLVYDVVPQHPLGLERGDIVLGYDRIPYKNLYKEMLDIQMPITGWAIGCSPSAFTHSILNAAGMNWHLFDTIDIRKFSSGDTVHLSTTALINKSMDIFCSEQMNTAGVPKPDYYGGHVVSYGKVQGTNIGYIYCWAWSKNACQEFYSAVKALMNTDGLIIDFRFNEGGNMFLSNCGLSLLFPYKVRTINFAGRKNKIDHLPMKDVTTPDNYDIPGTPPGYSKPIAVLTGPGAVSSGDQVALRMKYHPTAKLFGKPTSGAFSGPVWSYIGNEWFFRYSSADCYEIKNPDVYLTHKELPVDYDVWLTPEYVAQGRDNVVEAALNWINTSNANIENPSSYELSQNFPNPFNPNTTIKYVIKNEGFVRLKVYDVSGREITSLVNSNLKPGVYYVLFDGSGFASGVYFYRLTAEGYGETKRMLLIK
jgi:hypothetical protein